MDFFYPHSLEDTLVFNRWTMGKKTVELIWRNGMLNIEGMNPQQNYPAFCYLWGDLKNVNQKIELPPIMLDLFAIFWWLIFVCLLA